MSTVESPSRPIRVLVVEDHDVVRDGLVAVLGTQTDLKVVGAVATGEAALALYDEARPDVVLLDLHLPGRDGVQTLTELRTRHPRARVLMLSSREGDDAIHRALAAGALAYVLKRMPTAALLEAIRAAAAGKVPLAPEVLERLGTRSTFGALSPREIEVLQRIAGGASNKEIGAALGISANTVKNHINKILEKLGAADRTQAVTVALQRGIIDLD